MDSLKQYPSTIYFSNIITGIASGQQSVINDSIYYNYMLTINFPGKTIGYFNKDSVKGIDYSVDLKINNQYYSFPSYEFDTSDILKIKGNFELNINVYDLERHIISGTFKGILYNSDYIYQKDSVIITNGEFKSELKYK
jgi:hypothetical protein